MRVLVVGGSGGFGSTICRILAEEGHDVTAAGRSAGRGEALARILPSVSFLQADRDRITPDDLQAYDAVVDAAGPFREQDRSLARACIAAGCHHLDIADDRDFVRGVTELDTAARAAGVACISGASSVPALSSAVALRLAEGMEVVHHVEVAISASSQAAFGRSVMHSMLSGAGRRILRSDSTEGVAMTSPRRLEIRRGNATVLARQVLEVDGPDQDTLPPMLPGHPSVRFRAGGELTIHNAAMQAIAHAVSKGWMADGLRMAGLARLARLLTARMGDGRSAMSVRLVGNVQGVRMAREWNLLAERNMGPMIPCLVVPALIEALQDGRINPGARSAAGLVEVDGVLARMPEGSTSTESHSMPWSPVHARMLGFGRLAEPVRRMHDSPAFPIARGRASVTRGRGIAARIVAAAFGFPPAGEDMPVSVAFEPEGEGERWTRDFAGHRFHSVLTPTSTGLRERFGPLTFRFRLEERGGGLAMIPRSWRALGVRMPRRLMPSGIATEMSEEGRFTFDVPIRLPLVGLIVHYRGWLQPVPRGTGAA